jgi:hypothetical protein
VEALDVSRQVVRAGTEAVVFDRSPKAGDEVVVRDAWRWIMASMSSTSRAMKRLSLLMTTSTIARR